MEYVHPDDLPAVMTAFQEFMQDNKEARKIIYRNRCADGCYLWFETVGRFIFDENRNPQKILFNTRDITDRKKADEALQVSEEKYRKLFEMMHEGVLYRAKTSGKSSTRCWTTPRLKQENYTYTHVFLNLPPYPWELCPFTKTT